MRCNNGSENLVGITVRYRTDFHILAIDHTRVSLDFPCGFNF